MRIEYDPAYNIAYIRLVEDIAQEVQTLHLSEDVNLDMTPDGRLLGIELLNANAQLHSSPDGRLVLENRASGQRTALVLP